jgi:hypothetical protein
VLGLNRSAITAATGSLLAGILRFTDSLGFCQVDVPLSALAGSRAGLWVGWAMASQVGEYLKSYAVSTNNTAQLLVSSNGAYVVSELNTNWGAVPRPFPLRLIVHNPESSGNAVLLQRVYYGLDATTNWIVARSEGRLHRDWLPQARRISATHLPWTATNGSWSFDGRLGQATNLAATVWLDYADQASNPFLHTYHPDHDNLNASFTSTLPQGSESYAIRREISLLVQPPADDFTSLTASGQTLTGSYLETLSLLGLARAGGANDTRQFQVRGGFSLTRIASVPVLAP